MFDKITVIGAGLMGSAIAAHFSNAGCNVNLLDLIDKEKENKNHLADSALKRLSKIKPNPFTLHSNIKLINTGNLEVDLNIINDFSLVLIQIFPMRRNPHYRKKHHNEYHISSLIRDGECDE